MGLVLEVDPAGGSAITEGGVVLVVGKLKELEGPTVPTDLVGKAVEAAQALLSASGIPFIVTLREAEEPDVGTVLEADPAGETISSQGEVCAFWLERLKKVLRQAI